MKITFDGNMPEGYKSSASGKADEGGRASASRVNRGQQAYRAELYQGREGTWETGSSKGKGSTLKDLQQDAQAVDMEVLKNYRTVMSNTLSQEDYARMEKDGFSYEQLDPEEAVTIVDRIKVELARSGQDVEGYTDDLDVDTLTAVVGSRSLAMSIAESFAKNDIPLTQENVKKTLQAIDMATQLNVPGSSQYRYMVDNGMEPEIMSFYLAGNSVSGVGSAAGKRVADTGGQEGETSSVQKQSSGDGSYYKNAVQDRTVQDSAVRNRTVRSNAGQNNEVLVNTAQSSADQCSAAQSSTDQSNTAHDRRAYGGSDRDTDWEGTGDGYARTPEYYADDVEGYFAKSADNIDIRRLEGQIDRVIAQAGLEVNAQNRENAVWLLEQGLLLNPENLLNYRELKKVSFPVSQDQAIKASAAALAGGKEAYQGNLADTQNLHQKAADLADTYYNMDLQAFQERYGTIAARRQLEEIRLHMTAEVNVRLLRSGFSIDTAPMEELINALKLAEKQTANTYFPQDEQSVEKYRRYCQTCEVMDDIPGLPAAVLGRFSSGLQNGSLEAFHEEGRQLQDTYRRAGESYEALMTTPRSDMGDSINKAFSNIDDILKDLGVECSEQNRRAVRILGYNRMDMTKENIEQVNKADRTVQSVTDQMTPAATLQMIRDGINPLEQSMEDLNAYFQNQPENYEEQTKSYSRFLYGLEKRNEISSEERSAYIGIYRLLHQVEKSDGAAVGTLVNSSAEVNFSNLLSAVRTSRAGHMDAQVSDAFGTVSELMRKGVSISQQIEEGYGSAWKEVLTEAVENPENQRAYEEEVLNQVRQAANTQKECASLLQRGDISINAENLLAARSLLEPAGENIRRWTEKIEEKMQGTDVQDKEAAETSKDNGQENAPGAIWRGLEKGSDFREEYRQTLQDADAVVRALSLDEAETSLDVRELKLIHKELHIASQLSMQDEYFIPVKLGKDTTVVHLMVVQDSRSRGKVSASMELEGMGHVEGHFQLQEGKLSGYFTGNTQESITKLRKAADIFTESASREWEIETIQVMEGKPAVSSEAGGSAQEDELYQVARHFLEAIQTAAEE